MVAMHTPQGTMRHAKSFLLVCSISFNLIMIFYTTMDPFVNPTQGPMTNGTIQVKLRDEKKTSSIPGIYKFCKKTSEWTKHLINAGIQTNYKDWSFKSQRKCPHLELIPQTKLRVKISLNCDSNSLMMLKMLTTSTNDIETVKFGDKCLGRVIDHCCKGTQPVPNVVHYVWYANKELEYFNFLSFMSVIRFVKPCLILLHGDFVPYGRYWNYFISNTPNVVHVKREKPTHVFGNKLAYAEHASDVMRIEALKEYGGIYVDFDEIILRPLEPLRRYDYTQGHEMNFTLGSQLIMSKKNATFLTYWHHSYRDQYSKSWAQNALKVPYELAQRYPDLIHIEGHRFTNPNWKNVKKIFKENFNWKENYAMHLFIRWYKNKTDVNVIRTLNTTIGSVSRHVLFGNKDLCVD